LHALHEPLNLDARCPALRRAVRVIKQYPSAELANKAALLTTR
jgi:hypothetical protein